MCGIDLNGVTRIPVCADCLRESEPIQAEHFCIQCQTRFLNARPLNGEGLCRMCAAGITAFDSAFSCGDYDGALRELIHLYKYRRVRPLAAHFGRMMALAFPRDQRFDAIVPVPQHWIKYLARGFDHTGTLARALSRRTGVPVLPALRKVRHTPAQAGLTRAGRRTNAARSFRARCGAGVQGLNLLLLDDVLTTGATANAAASALKKAGAAHVSILTLARADRHGDWRAGAPARVVQSFEGALE